MVLAYENILGKAPRKPVYVLSETPSIDLFQNNLYRNDKQPEHRKLAHEL